MKKLINEIKKHITETNKYLAEDLINEIIKKSINNIEDLITLENNHFKIGNKSEWSFINGVPVKAFLYSQSVISNIALV